MRGAIFAVIGALAATSQVQAAPRIVSLDQCADQFVLALAPRDEIVGISRRALNQDSYLRADAVGLPQLRPTREAVLGARPSIAVRSWGGDLRLAQTLRRRGVQVVQIDEANDFPGVRANVRKVAFALDRQAAGEALIAGMDAKLAASRDAWGGTRALYLTPGGFTAGQGTLVGAMMQSAGLHTAATSAGYNPAPLEDLVLHPPSALVLGFFRDLAGGRQHWTIAGNGRVRDMSRQRAIASLPGSMLGCPGWFAADGTLALAQARGARR